VYIDCVQVHG